MTHLLLFKCVRLINLQISTFISVTPTKYVHSQTQKSLTAFQNYRHTDTQLHIQTHALQFKHISKIYFACREIGVTGHKWGKTDNIGMAKPTGMRMWSNKGATRISSWERESHTTEWHRCWQWEEGVQSSANFQNHYWQVAMLGLGTDLFML